MSGGRSLAQGRYYYHVGIIDTEGGREPVNVEGLRSSIVNGLSILGCTVGAVSVSTDNPRGSNPLITHREYNDLFFSFLSSRDGRKLDIHIWFESARGFNSEDFSVKIVSAIKGNCGPHAMGWSATNLVASMVLGTDMPGARPTVWVDGKPVEFRPWSGGFAVPSYSAGDTLRGGTITASNSDVLVGTSPGGAGQAAGNVAQQIGDAARDLGNRVAGAADMPWWAYGVLGLAVAVSMAYVIRSVS